MSPSMSASASPVPSNGALIRRLFGLAWRYRVRCLAVLGLQLVLLTMGILGLSFTGIGIDYILHRLHGTPLAPNRLHLRLPEAWPPMHVLAMLAGFILGLAICRAVLNYVYGVQLNILVQRHIVVDLRGEAYEKLQRLSFRFYDANTTGSIITRVTARKPG